MISLLTDVALACCFQRLFCCTFFLYCLTSLTVLWFHMCHLVLDKLKALFKFDHISGGFLKKFYWVIRSLCAFLTICFTYKVFPVTLAMLLGSNTYQKMYCILEVGTHAQKLSSKEKLCVSDKLLAGRFWYLILISWIKAILIKAFSEHELQSWKYLFIGPLPTLEFLPNLLGIARASHLLFLFISCSVLLVCF